MVKQVQHSIQAHQVVSAMTNTGMAMAIWKLPHDDKINLLASSSSTGQPTELDLVDGKPAFAIAPFNAAEREAFVLPADFLQSWKMEDKEERNGVFCNLVEQFDLDISINSGDTQARNLENILNPIQSDGDDRLRFENTVSKAVQNINEGYFDKVVVSRKKDFSLKEDLSVFEYFNQLTRRYPEAFVSMVYLPWSKEFWLGASPEILVHQDYHIFKTVSLAGTQSVLSSISGEELSTKDALWSQKEIEEQALVSRYIINRFKTVRVREYKEVGPRTVKAGKLLHLKSTFEVDTNEIGFKEMPTVMLGLLHPTSAVCGLPKEPALEFLKQHETYDRSFYSGFLGPINIQGSSQLYVNLRNLKKHQNTITTYAGCGITADSNPAKEWLETELKMNTILGI